MTTMTTGRGVAVLVLTAILVLPAGPAAARPRVARERAACPLQRIGRENLRCDSLTGAGLPAFPSVDERR